MMCHHCRSLYGLKHISVDASFMQSRVQDQVIALQYVRSEVQLLKKFTKAQTPAQLGFYVFKLKVVDPPYV